MAPGAQSLFQRFAWTNRMILTGKRDSAYPPVMIQVWENHRFISTLTKHLAPRGDGTAVPTLAFDYLYTEILTEYPGLLFFLQTQILLPQQMQYVLRLFRLTYLVFFPFLRLRGRVEFPFPEGDSPVDFVDDEARAGSIYVPRETTAALLVLRWIERAREFLTAGDFDLDPCVSFFLPSFLPLFSEPLSQKHAEPARPL